MPSREPERPTGSVREQFLEVRRELLRLHKALIDSERAVYEAREGTTSSGHFLQLLLQDPYFAWLRPVSGLLARMDEALSEPAELTWEVAIELAREGRELVTSDPVNTSFGKRYEEVRSRDPDVLFEHVRLARRLASSPWQV